MDNIIKQSNCSMLAPKFLNNCHIYITIGSKELLANLFKVFLYNKSLGIEINNMAKTT